MRTLFVALALGLALPVLPGRAESPSAAPMVEAAITVDALDPTPASNPAGAAFPGYRGGDQLIVYRRGQRTGTNEYGFEVTVADGRVTQREGANSAIPANGFVVSGHGKARAFILAHLPVGTAVILNAAGTQLTARQDPAASVWRAASALTTLERLQPGRHDALQRRLAAAWQRLPSQPAAAAADAEALLAVTRQATWAAYPTLPAGARATWYRPSETDAAGVERTVARAAAMGIDTLYLETLYHGYPIYRSRVYAQWGLPEQYPRFRGWDPFAAYLAAGARHGVTIVPWVHTMYVGHESLKPASPILARYPAWANRQRGTAGRADPVASTVEGGAYFLDPAHPDVARFWHDVLQEMVTAYRLAAIQLDDTRFPLPYPTDHPLHLTSTWGYTPIARDTFQRRYGRDPLALVPGGPLWSTWTEFRQQTLTGVVAGMSRAIRAASPTTKVQLDFAVNPLDSQRLALQDWPDWADRGLVDAFGVLNYTCSLEAIADSLRFTELATAGRVPMIGGVFGPFLNATPDETLAQMATAREAGAAVVSLFSLQQLSQAYEVTLPAAQFRRVVSR